MNFVRRSRSMDVLSMRNRESYLSQYNREKTPIDSVGDLARYVQRSFTPVREVGDYRIIEDRRRPLPRTVSEIRPPLGVISTPYHTNVDYYQEQQPLRKYDIFQVRTWAYPIYKYLHRVNYDARRPYSYTRLYGNTPLYTPPILAAEIQSPATRRGYSGYTYMAANDSFDISSKPYSLLKHQLWRPYSTSSPLYRSYYGNSGLTHYSSYRPRAYTSYLSTYCLPYY